MEIRAVLTHPLAARRGARAAAPVHLLMASWVFSWRLDAELSDGGSPLYELAAPRALESAVESALIGLG